MTIKQAVPPRLQQFMQHKGIDWVVLDRVLTHKELGTSPRESCWDGTRLVLGSDCGHDMLIHDLAHWIVANKARPDSMTQYNWGLNDRAHIDEETTTCYVDLGIRILVGYPWLDWGMEICMLDNGETKDQVKSKSIRITLEHLSSEDIKVLTNGRFL